MKEKTEIQSFFDQLANTWDAGMVRNEAVIAEILKTADIHEQDHVLDVACGTGVLFPDYRNRGAAVTGIDISENMAAIAAQKFQNEPMIQVICGDAQTYPFNEEFDSVVIYNAFPHFQNPEILFHHLSRYLKEGGRITIAHGMSRKKINAHHRGTSQNISKVLPPASELARTLSPWFEVDTVVDDAEKYIVSGIKKTELMKAAADELLKLCLFS